MANITDSEVFDLNFIRFYFQELISLNDKDFDIMNSTSISGFLSDALAFYKKQAVRYANKQMKRHIREDITEEEAEDYINNVKKDLHHDVIRKALLYCLLYPSKNAELYVNRILTSDFNNVLLEFEDNECFVKETLLYYTRYILQRYFNKITDEQIHLTEDRYYWIRDLYSRKGFDTLNDLARKVLIDIDEALLDVCAQKEEYDKTFDTYFSDVEDTYFLYQVFPSIKKDEIEGFKKYQMRIVVADAYLYLKEKAIATQMRDDGDSEYEFSEEDIITEEERKLLGLIEQYILEGNTTILDNSRIRHKLLSYFMEYNDVQSFYRDIHHQMMQMTDDIKTLKMINPIYFMD
jgi:hypothetical protein